MSLFVSPLGYGQLSLIFPESPSSPSPLVMLRTQVYLSNLSTQVPGHICEGVHHLYLQMGCMEPDAGVQQKWLNCPSVEMLLCGLNWRHKWNDGMVSSERRTWMNLANYRNGVSGGHLSWVLKAGGVQLLEM